MSVPASRLFHIAVSGLQVHTGVDHTVQPNATSPSMREMGKIMGREMEGNWKGANVLLISLTKRRRILQPRRLRKTRHIIQHLRKHPIRIHHPDINQRILPLQRHRHRQQHGIPLGNIRLLERLRRRPRRDRQRAAIHRRRGQEGKVARAGRVHRVDEAAVDGENGGVGGEGAARAVRVADVVDAVEEEEERVVAVPEGGVTVGGDEFLVDLVADGEDGGLVGCDEGGVDGCAAVLGKLEQCGRGDGRGTNGEVVGEQEAFVVGRGEIIHPIWAYSTWSGRFCGDTLDKRRYAVVRNG